MNEFPPLLLQLAESGAGMAICACSYLALEAMGWRTRHCFRVAYGLLIMTGIALVILPGVSKAYPSLQPLAHAALAVGVAIHLLIDRRRLDRNMKGRAN